MENDILKYQKAYNAIVKLLKSNEKVLATMVFGSIVSGDLWEESDIDLFVIIDEEMANIKNIYMEQNGVPIHIKLMGKNKFVLLNENDIKGGFFHRIFASSKLVFSKDKDITEKYDSGRYYPDIDREKWNMVYISDLLKSLGLCKKYLNNKRIYTAYYFSVKCVEEFSKLYINHSGYMVNKDDVNMLTNINGDFKNYIDNLFFSKENVEEAIKEVVDKIEEFINKNIKSITAILIDYMRDKDKSLSAEDINTDPVFNDFSINFEEILSKLWEFNIIKKGTRKYSIKDGKALCMENVYYL
ncbi:nucleotidyltransferase [Clostridium acetobutylicum]|nr:nucleotidyltransferase [Clostridium acetobutylicum]